MRDLKDEVEGDLVSIVIPTYNRSDILKTTIDSALRQTYKNIEVIVVDDGSTDNTEEICVEYGVKIRYFRKPNGGTASALNYGIKIMQGSWFKWLSSDDVLNPEAVEKLVNAAKISKCKIIYSDFDQIDENDNYISTFREHHCTDYYEFAARLLDNFVANGSTILIHRSCFDTVGLFDENLRTSEDYDWWLRACLVHRYMFWHVPEILLKYRRHAQQLTSEIDTSNEKSRSVKTTWYQIRKKTRRQIIASDKKHWHEIYSHYIDYQSHKSLGRRIRGLIRRMLIHLGPEREEQITDFYLKLRYGEDRT